MLFDFGILGRSCSDFFGNGPISSFSFIFFWNSQTFISAFLVPAPKSNVSRKSLTFVEGKWRRPTQYVNWDREEWIQFWVVKVKIDAFSVRLFHVSTFSLLLSPSSTFIFELLSLPVPEAPLCKVVLPNGAGKLNPKYFHSSTNIYLIHLWNLEQNDFFQLTNLSFLVLLLPAGWFPRRCGRWACGPNGLGSTRVQFRSAGSLNPLKALCLRKDGWMFDAMREQEPSWPFLYLGDQLEWGGASLPFTPIITFFFGMERGDTKYFHSSTHSYTDETRQWKALKWKEWLQVQFPRRNFQDAHFLFLHSLPA